VSDKDSAEDVTKRVFALRVRIRRQLEEWGAGPDSETCAALLSLAADCVDGKDPSQLQWFLGVAMSMASGNVATVSMHKLYDNGEGN
jgi:hypothetical protein